VFFDGKKEEERKKQIFLKEATVCVFSAKI